MTDVLERKALQRQFKRGELRVIWSVRTMTTGVDLPVSGIIDAAPTRSEMLHQQKIGRGLRINDDTPDLKIWDHAGNTLRLGFVTDLDWSELPKGKREDKKPREKKAPLPKECANCATLMEPKVKECPCCGEERKPPSGFIETAEGELVPIGGTEDAPKPAKVSMAVKQDWYSSFLGIAAERSYSAGWAYHKFREKFGMAPSVKLDKVRCEPLPEVRSWVKSRAIAFAKAKEARSGNA
jgi:DNA repair protein RadD